MHADDARMAPSPGPSTPFALSSGPASAPGRPPRARTLCAIIAMVGPPTYPAPTHTMCILEASAGAAIITTMRLPRPAVPSAPPRPNHPSPPVCRCPRRRACAPCGGAGAETHPSSPTPRAPVPQLRPARLLAPPRARERGRAPSGGRRPADGCCAFAFATSQGAMARLEIRGECCDQPQHNTLSSAGRA